MSESSGEHLPINVQQLSESDRKLLQKFRNEMNKLNYALCPMCNERFPSVNIINNESCRRCDSDKNETKKFSAENNMDPGDVPEELKALTEIEEMLIAQTF